MEGSKKEESNEGLERGMGEVNSDKGKGERITVTLKR